MRDLKCVGKLNALKVDYNRLFSRTSITVKTMDSSPVVKTWIIKRRLTSFANTFHVRNLSHSALMIKTKNDQEFVLEFMNDGKVHLYKTEYGMIGEKVPDVTDLILMRDEIGMEWTWVMQRHGQQVPKNKQVTPTEARKQIQRILGRDYDPVSENPHFAQEKMREYFDVEGEHDYLKEGFDRAPDGED